MEINADFSKRASVHKRDAEWVASPMPGVDRRMLDRLGDEVARATTIVRYAPESRFSPHVHTGGEEFLVLSGVFEDEHGAFPAGSYIRNPPESRHRPGSAPGCEIFVKLWQFDMTDRTHVRVDTGKAPWFAIADGGEAQGLFADEREDVRMERWAPGAEIPLESPDGLELLVTEGGFKEGGESFERESWLRLPKAASSKAKAGPDGATFWVKRNHLKAPPAPPAT
ncbi:MAG: cupin domain-containing protein [Pseudomonadota bacterium]